MALINTRRTSELGTAKVLAPERYDPRRSLDRSGQVRVSDIADIVRKVVSPGAIASHCSVFDTSDAFQGVIGDIKPLVTGNSIGSAKKEAATSDVVISRLRPYLRQVALVDEGLLRDVPSDTRLLFSTEFFVLRSKKVGESIAFLVPFLLSDPIQAVLSAAQEGGHHPRVNEDTVQNLPVPEQLLATRDDSSKAVEAAVGLHRASVNDLKVQVSDVSTMFAATAKKK